MSEYIGNRIVPRHDGVWDKAKEYEPLTIVYEESTGDSYMSRKPVPAGTLLSQEEYWAMCSRFSEQMALYRQNTAEEVEQFRKDTAADVEQLRTDTASDVAVLRKMTAQDVADITQKVDAANSAVAASKSEMDKTAEMLKAQINANVKASTDKNANYAQELVDVRVDDEGKTYPTAGDNIRAVGRVRSMQNIMKNWVIKNGYANQNGNLVASESWRVAHMVPVSGDAILVDGQFGYMSGRDDYNNVVCYDMDRKFLGGCFRAESGKVYDNYVITLLPNTRFISVTTNEKLFSKLSVYLYDNMLPMRLLSNYATGWQWMNGSVDIRFTGSKVTVTFPEGKSVYVCRRTNGIQYEQTKLVAENSTSFDFAVVGKWWAIYYDGAEASANETGEKTEVPVIKVENTSGDSWGDLFTKGRFVFAVFFDWNVVYAAPSSSGTVINGIDYGNPAKIANTAMTWHKYRSAKMFLATGQFAIDTVNRTIQVTKRILAVVDNGAYYWISASEEPVPMLDSTEAEKHHMLILAYDSSIDQINLYNTAQFRALGVNGYYIAAWYENHFWYPHMGSSFSIVLDGTTYKAGELFDEERRDSYIEKKYEDRFQQLRTDLAGKDSRHMYLASGGITIDQDAGTIQVITKCLGVPDTFHYEWIMAGDPVEMAFNTPSSTFGMPMRILAYDAGTKTINLYDTSLFRKLGTNGFYIASWYQSKLYNPHIHPDVKFIVGGKEYKAGDLFADNAASFIPKRITDYVQKAITPAVEDDIVTPSHWDCMEGRQLSIFFDCLSRHDGKENLYVLARGTNAPSLTRNEYCMNYTPTKESTDFALTVRRLDEDDCHTVSSKPVQVRVHHICHAEKVYEEQVVRAFRKAVLERFRLTLKPIHDNVAVADIMSGRFKEQYDNFTPEADSFVSQMLARLESIQKLDFMERDRAFYKKQIAAAHTSVESTSKKIRLLKSQVDVMQTRLELLGDEMIDPASIEEKKKLIEKLECDIQKDTDTEQKLTEQLDYMEDYWEELEGDYERREKAIEWMKNLPAGRDGTVAFLNEVTEEHCKAFLLSITIHSPLKFTVHWFDDTKTEVEMDSNIEDYRNTASYYDGHTMRDGSQRKRHVR